MVNPNVKKAGLKMQKLIEQAESSKSKVVSSNLIDGKTASQLLAESAIPFDAACMLVIQLEKENAELLSDVKKTIAQVLVLKEALENLCGRKDMVGWLGEIIDNLSDYDDEYVAKQVRQLGLAKMEGEKALSSIPKLKLVQHGRWVQGTTEDESDYFPTSYCGGDGDGIRLFRIMEE